MNFLTTFIILSIINVVFSTIRSITTIKSGKTIASLISGGYFAFYNVMIIYTVADFPLWEKCVITFACNVVGVFVVKLVEEKMRKDKLWKIEMTVRSSQTEDVNTFLESVNIPYSFVIDNTGTYAIYNIYCKTQKQSACVKELVKKFRAKYFASESKTL